MDWDAIYREQKERKNAPRLELVETRWRMRSLQKSTRILECGIYRTAGPGLEVRCGYSVEDLLLSQRTADIESAREIAEAWRQAVIAKGGFEEIPRSVAQRPSNPL
jgi:hypothetical protein